MFRVPASRLLLDFCAQLPRVLTTLLKMIDQLTMPNPLLAVEETSVMIAMDKLTLPLLMPPTTRASTNSAKLCENAHRTYENAIPT